MIKVAILQCIAELEGKLAELRQAVEDMPDAAEMTPASVLTDQGEGVPVEERSRTIRFVDKHKLYPLFARAFGTMGIYGEPIGAEKVQEMIAACGAPPEDSLFSRELIEMREE